MVEQWRGTLYPARLPEFHRILPAAELADRVRWVWIPEWNLAPGRVSRQEVLPFPALNLVVDKDGVTLSGPATRRSFRDLSGRGWAVGLLLRPAAVPVFTDDPGNLRDTEIPVDAPDLLAAVVAAMADVVPSTDDDDAGAGREGAGAGVVPVVDPAEVRRAAAVAAASRWLEAHGPTPDAEGRLANRLEDLIPADASITRVDQLAGQLGVSVRTVQRLARRFVGLPPLAMIRRYRLQEAAERLRLHPETPIADVAADLGYADHAHLAADFREVLGFTPSGYRRSAADS
ncbi:helix-turn-helix transcriptional regulator [Arthrobacter sp. zg-Y20]|uniref:helix-turn-helix transcriptional regulator n=1 Tax=unclassified Arthrobacter TaxID=235627 RepID=UPI001D15CFDB|nr:MULTISPECIES: helix-turn-helix transcriptional regulator [unclassified Arthrobacter]MCC3276573.1 helix-turn-helix transcriptional regulator [Arthrobacter sp. zg-Y20]MDK1316733.1 helix-turn-helix transcriptional regulator [Arthrobacter sp. zg.Y20]WIB06845.1 helix-turn-helix transcriptional regulator [Arthrobacter sp. zg-Y20]